MRIPVLTTVLVVSLLIGAVPVVVVNSHAPERDRPIVGQEHPTSAVFEATPPSIDDQLPELPVTEPVAIARPEPEGQISDPDDVSDSGRGFGESDEPDTGREVSFAGTSGREVSALETEDITDQLEPVEAPEPAPTPEPAPEPADEPEPAQEHNPECLNPSERDVLRLINEYREELGLPQLKNSRALNIASFEHSRDMGERDYLAHETPEGLTPFARMSRSGYSYDTVMAENLAGGQSTAERVVEAWRASPDHDETLRNPDLRVVGIARFDAPQSHYKVYWTTKFGGYVDESPSC